MRHARHDYNRIQDPYNLIAKDEPVFLLRAQDKAAPATVRAWAELHTLGGGDPMLAQMACDHADEMEDWQARNLKKSADL